MNAVFFIVMIVCGSITVTVLGCVWMGTSYSAKKTRLPTRRVPTRNRGTTATGNPGAKRN